MTISIRIIMYCLYHNTRTLVFALSLAPPPLEPGLISGGRGGAVADEPGLCGIEALRRKAMGVLDSAERASGIMSSLWIGATQGRPGLGRPVCRPLRGPLGLLDEQFTFFLFALLFVPTHRYFPVPVRWSIPA